MTARTLPNRGWKWARPRAKTNELLVIRKPAMPNGVHKRDLPSKTCPVCARPFAWRKKWARDWENVVYCSDKCRKLGR